MTFNFLALISLISTINELKPLLYFDHREESTGAMRDVGIAMWIVDIITYAYITPGNL